MKHFIKTLPHKIKALLEFLLNPRFLLCFGLGWMITNGWSYILLGIGSFYGIGWMSAIAAGYLAILWFPFSPEKIVTVGIAIALLKWLFPNDKKTLAVLHDMHTKALTLLRGQKQKRRDKRNARREKRRQDRALPPEQEGAS